MTRIAEFIQFINPLEFAKSSLGILSEQRGYTNFLMLDAVQIPTCSVGYQLTVRLGDLAICPCHRTAYPETQYGSFVVEDDHIVDIHANNPVIASKILLSNQRKSHHGCDTCWNVNSCIRGCFGAQLEYGQEMFFPIEAVCNMLKAKTKCLLRVYEELGIIDALSRISTDDVSNVYKCQSYMNVLNSLKAHKDDN